jgi:hypothetical protein
VHGGDTNSHIRVFFKKSRTEWRRHTRFFKPFEWKTGDNHVPCKIDISRGFSQFWLMNSGKNVEISLSLAIHQAMTAVHRAALEAMFQHIGLQEIDGVPLQKWFDARFPKELEKILLAMGDTNPAAHDAIMACLAEAKKNAPKI